MWNFWIGSHVHIPYKYHTHLLTSSSLICGAFSRRLRERLWHMCSTPYYRVTLNNAYRLCQTISERIHNEEDSTSGGRFMTQGYITFCAFDIAGNYSNLGKSKLISILCFKFLLFVISILKVVINVLWMKYFNVRCI